MISVGIMFLGFETHNQYSLMCLHIIKNEYDDQTKTSQSWIKVLCTLDVHQSAIFVTRLSSRAVYFHTNQVTVF